MEYLSLKDAGEGSDSFVRILTLLRISYDKEQELFLLKYKTKLSMKHKELILY